MKNELPPNPSSRMELSIATDGLVEIEGASYESGESLARSGHWEEASHHFYTVYVREKSIHPQIAYQALVDLAQMHMNSNLFGCG